MTNINFNKDEIIKDLSQNIGYSSNYSKKLINDLLNCMIDNICNSDLKLKNFGSFKILNKSKRIGRNPKTKEEFIIKSRKSLKFTPSKKLLSLLNDN